MSLLADLQLIVGLGNPGNEYNNTWHNIGFMFIDYLKNQLQEEFVIINKKEYELVYYPDLKLNLVKPLKFMNRSGEVISEIIKFKEIQPDQILIAHDDLDLKFGEFKIQQGRYPKSHNGILSIHEKTGETNFHYLRIGIETRTPEMNMLGEEYVLTRIPEAQKEGPHLLFKRILKDLGAK